MRREVLMGCGSRRDKMLSLGPENSQWEGLVTLDSNPNHKPDIVFDLADRNLRLPFDDNSIDELHFYDVLEHLGNQGDALGFFIEFSAYWRVLKPAGLLCATVPRFDSLWAWGDPSHTRIINRGTLIFLSQEQYRKGVGHTPMSDFRHYYKADFDVAAVKDWEDSFCFILRAVKPARL